MRTWYRVNHFRIQQLHFTCTLLPHAPFFDAFCFKEKTLQSTEWSKDISILATRSTEAAVAKNHLPSSQKVRNLKQIEILQLLTPFRWRTEKENNSRLQDRKLYFEIQINQTAWQFPLSANTNFSTMACQSLAAAMQCSRSTNRLAAACQRCPQEASDFSLASDITEQEMETQKQQVKAWNI